MGISLIGSGSFCSCGGPTSTPSPVNPNPRKFKTLKAQRIGPCTVTLIEYEGCTNYEGRKILVFWGYRMSVEDVFDAKFIDPHFCQGQHISPIARFVPTAEGWAMAKTFAQAMEIRGIR